MPRQITLEEAALVIQLEHRVAALLRGDQSSRQPYEATLDQLVKLARPALTARQIAEALIPETPSAPDPDAPVAAAGPSLRPPKTGGGLVTEEGLRDALAEWQIDTISGVVQISIDGWVDQIHTYILRHCARQTEAREAAE